jgi:hypothetical protein
VSRLAAGSTRSPIRCEPRALFSGVQQPQCEDDHPIFTVRWVYLHACIRQLVFRHRAISPSTNSCPVLSLWSKYYLWHFVLNTFSVRFNVASVFSMMFALSLFLAPCDYIGRCRNVGVLSLTTRNHVSHLYKTTGKVIVFVYFNL